MNAQSTGNPRPPRESWLPAEFLENSEKFPSEELMKYAGKHIAWSLDGTGIVVLILGTQPPRFLSENIVNDCRPLNPA